MCARRRERVGSPRSIHQRTTLDGVVRTRGPHETHNEVTPHDEESAMKFLFDDESFSFETLRTAGFAAYGGADLGEGLPTAPPIGEGDGARWHPAWEATLQRGGGNRRQAP